MTTRPRTGQRQRPVARVVASGAVALVIVAGSLGATRAESVSDYVVVPSGAYELPGEYSQIPTEPMIPTEPHIPTEPTGPYGYDAEYGD